MSFRLIQHIIIAARSWNSIGQIVERHMVCGHIISFQMAGMVSRLGKAMVESTLATACNVYVCAVHDHAPFLIDMKSLPEHVGDKPP